MSLVARLQHGVRDGIRLPVGRIIAGCWDAATGQGLVSCGGDTGGLTGDGAQQEPSSSQKEVTKA